MRKLLLFILLVFSVLSLSAQEEKIQPAPRPTVFFAEVSKGNVSADKASAIRNAMVNAIVATGRVIAIDAESEAIAKREDIRRSKDNATAGDDCYTERMGAVVSLGAQMYLKINIDKLTFEHKKGLGDTKNSAWCNLVTTLKLIDPAQSKILKTKQVEFDSNSSDDSESSAFKSLLTSIDDKSKITLFQNQLYQAVEEFFPIMCQLIQIDQSKKNEAKTVYINAGSDHGVNKDIILEVFSEKTVGNRVAHVKIGEIKVTEVQGEDLSLCKVSKGGDKIFSAFNEGTILKAVSRPKKGLF